MSRFLTKYLLVASFGLLVLVGVFWLSGGFSLVRLYSQYFLKRIPDRKYSYSDFTDQGPRQTLHGYYAWSVGERIYIWTFSGLRSFSHHQGTSVYYYFDVCGAVGQATGNGKLVDSKERVGREPWMTYSYTEWVKYNKRGDYIWVKRVGEGDESKIIDKAWISNNFRYPYGGVSLTECKDR